MVAGETQPSVFEDRCRPLDAVAGQGFQCKREILIVIQLAALIVLVKHLVSPAIAGFVDDVVFDHVFAPQVIAVAGQQGMVEIEYRERHG